MYALGISDMLMLLLQLVIVVFGRRTVWVTGAMGAGCAAAIFGLVALVFGIMYLFFLIKLGKRFRAEAQIARQTWGQTPAGNA